jgi:hypothetical protein
MLSQSWTNDQQQHPQQQQPHPGQGPSGAPPQLSDLMLPPMDAPSTRTMSVYQSNVPPTAFVQNQQQQGYVRYAAAAQGNNLTFESYDSVRSTSFASVAGPSNAGVPGPSFVPVAGPSNPGPSNAGVPGPSFKNEVYDHDVKVPSGGLTLIIGTKKWLFFLCKVQRRPPAVIFLNESLRPKTPLWTPCSWPPWPWFSREKWLKIFKVS